MKPEATPTVNSREYWEHRFATDWDALGGPAQTHYFGRLFGEILPLPIRAWISEHARSVLDWGCGTGEAAAFLQSLFPYASVTGLDFSPTAISRAAAKYPEVRFTSASLDELDEYFDLIFVSNTLEHFDEPWRVADGLATRTRRLLIALVPFREVSRIAEHVVTITPANVPLAVGGLELVHYSVHTANPRFWPGRQLLLVYASADVWDAEARVRARDQSVTQHLTVEDLRELLEAPALEAPTPAGRSTVDGFLISPPGSEEAGGRRPPRSSGICLDSSLFFESGTERRRRPWRRRRPSPRKPSGTFTGCAGLAESSRAGREPWRQRHVSSAGLAVRLSPNSKLKAPRVPSGSSARKPLSRSNEIVRRRSPPRSGCGKPSSPRPRAAPANSLPRWRRRGFKRPRSHRL